MAILNHGLMGGMRGKFGDVVVYEINGKLCVRSRVTHMTNPKTVRQRATRARMKGVVRLSRSLLDSLIHPVWKRRGMRSPYNGFIQANIHAFGPDGLVYDPSMLVFSKGNLPAPEGLTAIVGEPGEIILTWTSDAVEGSGLGDDRLWVVVFCNNEAVVADGVTAARKEGKATFRVPFAAGSEIVLYAFFTDPVSGECSDTAMASLILIWKDLTVRK